LRLWEGKQRADLDLRRPPAERRILIVVDSALCFAGNAKIELILDLVFYCVTASNF
jgi:hypothetical protein